MKDTQLHALDYLSVIRRRKWWLIAPIVASVGIGVALVTFLPKEYKSSTSLAVSAPLLSPNLVTQDNQLDNQERQRVLQQQMLSTSILARVATEERLTSGTASDRVIAVLRKSIQISVPEPVANTNEPRRLDTFIVSVTNSEPGRAQRIANRLASVFVDENSRMREARAEDTSAFLAAQVRESQVRLTALDARLRQAKESHMGRLPEQTQANLQTLAGMRQQLEANATALRSEQDRLTILERQIEAMRQGSAEAPLSRGREPLVTQSRVATVERQLAAARAMYTDKHPEIQRLQEELMLARGEAATEGQRPVAERDAQLQADPLYRQLTDDREVGRLRIQELHRTGTETQRQIAIYQARVEAAPMVEQQLASLQREYDLQKAEYGNLSSRLQAAALVESVERNRGGQLFTILYPATLPTEPIKPIPMQVMLASILGGLVAGAALTLGREYLDRSVHDLHELRDEFDLPVLGEIGRIQVA